MREKTSYEEARPKTHDTAIKKTPFGSYVQLSKFQQKEFAHLEAVRRREEKHLQQFPGK